MSVTIPETFFDLLRAPGGVAILTTRGPDGYPQTSALWFLFDDDGAIKFTLNTARQKTRNLIRDGRVTLFLIDPANPYRTLEVRADAVVDEDAEGIIAEKVSVKYGSRVQDNDRPGDKRITVTLTPVRVNAFPHP